MKIKFGFVIFMVSLTFCVSAQSNDQIANLLKDMNAQILNSKELKLEFTTAVINLSAGTRDDFNNIYYKKGIKYYSVQNNVTTIQNSEVNLVVDQSANNMVLSSPKLASLPTVIDYNATLQLCVSKSLIDTLGMQLISLFFDDGYPISSLRIYLKNKLPHIVEIEMKDGKEKYLTRIEYQRIELKANISESYFSTKKYLKLVDSKYRTTDQYKKFKLYNLLIN